MVGLQNGINKRGINLKKTLLIILCALISISFVACNKNTNNNASDTTNETSNVQNSDVFEESTLYNNEEINLKKIIKLYVSYKGINIDIANDENSIAEFLALEESATVPETKLYTKFADITAVYDDKTESTYATIYIGEDNGYYLKFENSEIEGSAYKISNNSFKNNLF